TARVACRHVVFFSLRGSAAARLACLDEAVEGAAVVAGIELDELVGVATASCSGAVASLVAAADGSAVGMLVADASAVSLAGAAVVASGVVVASSVVVEVSVDDASVVDAASPFEICWTASLPATAANDAPAKNITANAA